MITNDKIAIIGLGYVGLPLAHAFAEKYDVIGFDINQSRIDELSQGIDRTLELNAEQLQEVATMVDMRFGHGTWAGILAERAKRIHEQKEAEAVARKEAARKHKELQENIKNAMIVIGVIVITIGLFFILMVSIAKAVGIA